jgi:hypothetical protein
MDRKRGTLKCQDPAKNSVKGETTVYHDCDYEGAFCRKSVLYFMNCQAFLLVAAEYSFAGVN